MKKIDSISIGGFDGMHVAHQHLFTKLSDKGAVLAIETGYADMTPSSHRQEHTHYPIFYYDLNDIKSLSGEEFVEKLKSDFPSLKTIVVGFDFCFGNNRSCSTKELQELFDGDVIVVGEVKIDNEAVHSRLIRTLLDNGKLEKANLFLGYNYQIKGKVVSGQGVGKEKLVPTINIEIKAYRLPKDGVYATMTHLDDDTLYPSVSFIGNRHITDGSFAVETHILDKDVKAGENAEISFLHYIRENMEFDSYDDLKSQIKNDITKAKNIINHIAL